MSREIKNPSSSAEFIQETSSPGRFARLSGSVLRSGTISGTGGAVERRTDRDDRLWKWSLLSNPQHQRAFSINLAARKRERPGSIGLPAHVRGAAHHDNSPRRRNGCTPEIARVRRRKRRRVDALQSGAEAGLIPGNDFDRRPSVDLEILGGRSA